MRIVVNLSGGFGNQLFEYAFGYALSQKLHTKLYIDTSLYDYGTGRKLELLNFNIKYFKKVAFAYYPDIINRLIFNKLRKYKAIGWKTQEYIENDPTRYDIKTTMISRDTFFKGYWQSEKYFKKYRKDLLEMLQPRNEPLADVKELIEIMSQQASVAIHVRRGDYVTIGCQLSMDFYDKAIELMKETLGNNLIFYVFSDDIVFCRQYFEKKLNDTKIIYPEYRSANHTFDDLWIMSHCKHIIIANSTYSWWGAWLNQNRGKIVVCPELGIWTGDFYPEEWMKIKM